MLPDLAPGFFGQYHAFSGGFIEVERTNRRVFLMDNCGARATIKL